MHSPSKIFDMLQRLFDLLQKSTIAHREIPDPKQRSWKTYRTVAEAFDNEFLARYRDDMDVSMIFVSDVARCRDARHLRSSYNCSGWTLLRRLRNVPLPNEARSRPGSERRHASSSSDSRHLAKLFRRLYPTGFRRTHLDWPERDYRLRSVLVVRQSRL